MITIYRKHLEMYNPETRDIQDNRKKISKAVFSYYDDNNNEYRKSFTGPVNMPEAEYWNIAPKTIRQNGNNIIIQSIAINVK